MDCHGLPWIGIDIGIGIGIGIDVELAKLLLVDLIAVFPCGISL